MKLTHSLGVKITAIFLFALLSFAVIAGIGLIVMMLGQGYYWAEGELPADTALNAAGKKLCLTCRTESRWTCMRSRHFSLERWS